MCDITAISDDPKTVEAACREAIRRDPDDAEAHCRLGQALGRLGRFREGLDALERGHALGSKQPGWPYPSSDWVERARRSASLEAQLPDVLAGRVEPADPIEQADLAEVAAAKGLEGQAVRMLLDAFATRPELVNDLSGGRRQRAARIAARAGMPHQALVWLSADLEAWVPIATSRRAEPRQIAVVTLSRWKSDPDLAILRHDPQLPEADRAACRALWTRLDALLRQADGQPGP
jgi:hypothetical protein